MKKYINFSKLLTITLTVLISLSTQYCFASNLPENFDISTKLYSSRGSVMKKYNIKTVDAFTSTPFNGNPAGVVTDATGLSKSEMQKIAKEMNLVETTFVFPSEKADFLIRYFTPQNEVAVAGHPTIATIHALIEEAKIDISKTKQIHIETGAGVLPVDLDIDDSGNPKITMTMATPKFENANISCEQMAKLLGTDVQNIDSCGIQKVYVGLYWFVVRLTNLSSIQNLNPDMPAIAKLSRDQKVTGIQVFTTETEDTSCDFHVRTFLPNEGINEDPVCGTGNSCIGAFIVKNKIIKTNECAKFKSEQGSEVGRPGNVYVEVQGTPEAITKVKISGTAITILNGQLNFK